MRPRVVIDSSVLVSAFLTPEGTTAEVLHAEMRERYVLCLSPEIITETIKKLRSKEKLKRLYGYDEPEIERYLVDLSSIAELVTDLPDCTGAVPNDPKDDVIVATAMAANADYLVAGDHRHLIKLGKYDGIPIITPRRFLEIIEGGGK